MSSDGPPAAHDQYPHQREGVMAGIAAYLVWGCLTFYWRHLHRFDAVELIGWRVICSAVVMTIVLSATRRWRDLRPVLSDRRVFRSVSLCAVFLAANWTTFVWAVVHDHVIETALGYFLSPLGTMALGVIVLHERLSRVQQFVFVMAVVAVVVLTVSYGRVPWLALLIAATWTIYGYLKKGMPLTPLESMAAESFIVLVPAIAVVLLMSGSSDSIVRSANGGELALVMCSGLATIIPLTLFAFAAQRVALTVIAPLNYINPTINFLLGWLAFHEPLPASRVIGFSIVWLGLIIATADVARRSRQRPATAADPVPV